MVFKQNWEKASQHYQFPQTMINEMLMQAFSDKIIANIQLIAGGGVNLNYKVQFKNDNQPVLLRIYMRDKLAAYKEQKIADTLKSKVPIATTHYIGNYQNYYFAIVEFKEGILLRDLILSNESYELKEIMHQVGLLLTVINDHKFEKAGFLDQDLNIKEEVNQDSYFAFAIKCLQHKVILAELEPELRTKINYYLIKYKDGFPSENEKNLVHGDFDPSNMLVIKNNDEWQISAILDWEFAFSGSIYTDIANMLRYAHKMPIDYTDGFIEGLGKKNVHLINNWQIKIHMLNLVALLDCLVRTENKNSPNKRKDIGELINYILNQLDKEK